MFPYHAPAAFSWTLQRGRRLIWLAPGAERVIACNGLRQPWQSWDWAQCTFFKLRHCRGAFGFESHPHRQKRAVQTETGSTPTTGASPDRLYAKNGGKPTSRTDSKNITPSREVCNFGSCGSRRLDD